MMRVLRQIAPIGSVALLTLLAVLPWGLPAEARFMLPMLPVIAIHYWTLRHDAWIPEWFVFLAGLTLDVLTQGPLGYWSLIYLATHLIATFSSRFADQGTAFRLVLLGAALGAIAIIAWAVSSIYFFEFADPWPYASGAALAALAACVLVPMLRALDAPEWTRSNPRLARRY